MDGLRRRGCEEKGSESNKFHASMTLVLILFLWDVASGNDGSG